MGNGMADYILDEEFNVNGVATVEDYNLYCHYVAGLVGEGLTNLFVLANFGDKTLTENNFAKADSMGLFLQKQILLEIIMKIYKMVEVFGLEKFGLNILKIYKIFIK